MAVLRDSTYVLRDSIYDMAVLRDSSIESCLCSN